MGSFFNLQVTNSTTYADQLAIQLGLYQDRLVGETSDHFLDRLYQAAYSKRDHTLEGTINELCYHLGLSAQPAITISSTDPSTVITVSAGQITFVPAIGSPLTISTVSISADNMWVWRNLSDIVSDINTLSKGAITAVLNVNDGLAIQLVPQTSLGCSVAEPVNSAFVQLKYSGIITGTELFNNTVPSYTLESSGEITFSASPTSGTTISYIYNLSPFNLTCSQVSVINLMDPALQTTALCPDGSMVYQVKEFNQAILSKDPCYWGS